MSKFLFLPEVTTSGIAFEAYGRTERKLLQNAAFALEEAIVDTKTLRSRVTEPISIRATSLEDLILRFLEHLFFLKSAKGLVFRDVKLGIERHTKSFVLQGFAYGEVFDSVRHKLRSNVKSLNRDLFEINRSKSMLSMQVVLEV